MKATIKLFLAERYGEVLTAQIHPIKIAPEKSQKCSAENIPIFQKFVWIIKVGWGKRK